MTSFLSPVLTLWGRALHWLVLAWWRWALSEIDPLDPDVPVIVRRISELERL